MIKRLSSSLQKYLESDNSTGEYCQTLKEEVTQILHNLYQKVEKEGTLPNSL